MSSLILLILVVCLCPLQAATLEEFAAKLKPLAQNKTVQADFTQIRHLKELDFTMTVKGQFAQESGRRLVWKTTEPLVSICLIMPKSMQFWDAETKRTNSMNAKQFPWIQMIFTLQSQWLNGDLMALKKDFTITVTDDQTLKLIPTAPAIQTFFQEITVRFTPDFTAVATVLFREKTGDLITLEFKNVKNNQPLPDSLFAIPDK